MKKKLLLPTLYCFLLFSVFSIDLFAQDNNANNYQSINEDKVNKWNNEIGTFQFQIINSRVQLSVPVEVIDLIDSNRKENELVYIDYMENVRIMILPKNLINSGKFEKLDLFSYLTIE